MSDKKRKEQNKEEDIKVESENQQEELNLESKEEDNTKEKNIFLDCVKAANDFWEDGQEKKVDFYIQN